MTNATAFLGLRRLRSGPLPEVAALVRRTLDADSEAQVLVFDDADGRVVDLDLRETPEEMQDRHGAARGRGRPKLGVSAREVTLLPRHWDWLAGRRGGASAALRALVDEAMRADPEAEGRARREAAYRFLQALAGDLPGYEGALRALFAGDRTAFEARVSAWPPDVRGYAGRLAYGEVPARG